MSTVNTMKNDPQPLVSVVLATYNGEKFITEQIDSILAQSYRNIELIICDDGSTDSTIELIKGYMERYEMVRLYRNSEPLGFVGNFEKGISLSSAEYIALCDQDDIWENDKLELSMSEMKRQERRTPGLPVMVHSDLSVIDEKGHLLHASYFRFKRYRLKETRDIGHIAGPCGVMGNTVLFNQALKEKILPFPACITFHDQWIALVNEVQGERVTINRPLVRYRLHRTNISNSYEKTRVSLVAVIRAFLKNRITPPYLDSGRLCMIEHILKEQPVSAEAGEVLKYFRKYLLRQGGKWDRLQSLWRYDLLKRDLLYRVGFSINFLCYEDKEETKLYFFGFSHWKRHFIKYFFPSEARIIFCDTLENAIEKGLKNGSEIYIWGKKAFEDVESYAQSNAVKLFRVEDGFIRSVSLGSDLTKAYSLVIDGRGIYFDPTTESDLEHILNTYVFEPELIRRAKRIQKYLTKNKISKYNADMEKDLTLPGHRKGQKVVFLPGQVEDDASIQYGANGMTNRELMEEARRQAPEAYIVYKPHPDVVAGNRKGKVGYEEAMKYCDLVIENIGLDSILAFSDEVHTMTSLVGFEALIRNKKVYTYGSPFYAGWGLTVDKQKIPRRKRLRTLDELVAAALILYPRYINPANNRPCEIEVLLEEIDKEKKRYNRNIIYRVYRDARNTISRRIQQMIKVYKDE